MTAPNKNSDYVRKGRKDRLLRELVHDPYMSKRKLPEPTVCPECGAVFRKAKWEWAERPENANEELCPACQRVRDKVPAGYLSLSGKFLSQHKDEIMNLVHNVEDREKTAHPLKRIMEIEEQKDGVLITLTDSHLTRGIGEAVNKAYQGDLDFKYTDEDTLLRVTWTR